jgi:hypothetical protein
VDHPGTLGPQKRQRARDELGQFRARHADELPGGAGRIGQRPEEVERRPDPEFLACRRGVPHRRVERRREEERDAGLDQAALDGGRRRPDVDAERLEHIRAAAPAGHGSVAVLRHAHAAGRDDERRDGRDVERVRAIPAGAARIEHRVMGGRELRGSRPHDAGQADDLGRAFPFHGQGDEQPGDLRRLRLARHDGFHRGRRLLGREVLAPLQFLEQSREHHISRKFLRIWRPSSVRTDSGWNCTP